MSNDEDKKLNRREFLAALGASAVSVGASNTAINKANVSKTAQSFSMPSMPNAMRATADKLRRINAYIFIKDNRKVIAENISLEQVELKETQQDLAYFRLRYPVLSPDMVFLPPSFPLMPRIESYMPCIRQTLEGQFSKHIRLVPDGENSDLIVSGYGAHDTDLFKLDKWTNQNSFRRAFNSMKITLQPSTLSDEVLQLAKKEARALRERFPALELKT